MKFDYIHVKDYIIIFLIFILFLFGLFSVLYIVQVPAFESHDEIAHYYRIVDGKLVFNIPPALNAELLDLEQDEKEQIEKLLRKLERMHNPFIERTILSRYQQHQPPLYYKMIGFLFEKQPERGIDLFLNPFFFDGFFNLFYHEIADHSSYKSISINVRYFRIVSTIIMLLCVILFFLILHEVFPNKSLLIFTGLFMLLAVPQFIYTGSIINNDILLLLFSFASVYLFFNLINADYKNPVALILLLIILPSGIFVKISYIVIIISFTLYFLIFEKAFKRKFLLYFLGFSIFILLIILSLDKGLFIKTHKEILSYIYNISQTPLGTIPFKELASDLFKSFYAVFGWKNVYLKRFDYLIYFFISSVFIFSFISGFIKCMKKKQEKQKLFILNMIIIITNTVMFLIYYIVSKQPQGRFLFISLPSIIIILLFNIKNNRRVLIGFCVFFFLWGIYINGYATFKAIPSAYKISKPLYKVETINEANFYIIPGLGFRYFTNEIYYYNLAILDIYATSYAEGIDMKFEYSLTPYDIRDQIIISASDNYKIINGTMEQNILAYRLGKLKYGRNRFYIYNKYSDDSDTDQFNIKNLEIISLK